MSVMEKTYNAKPPIVWNLINDVVEMRKGKVTHYDADSMTVSTDMYGIKTEQVFRVTRAQGGSLVAIETDGDGEDDRRSAGLAFLMLDNMLEPFESGPPELSVKEANDNE